jgi:hypothetical protein
VPFVVENKKRRKAQLFSFAVVTAVGERKQNGEIKVNAGAASESSFEQKKKKRKGAQSSSAAAAAAVGNVRKLNSM